MNSQTIVHSEQQQVENTGKQSDSSALWSASSEDLSESQSAKAIEENKSHKLHQPAKSMPLNGGPAHGLLGEISFKELLSNLHQDEAIQDERLVSTPRKTN